MKTLIRFGLLFMAVLALVACASASDLAAPGVEGSFSRVTDFEPAAAPAPLAASRSDAAKASTEPERAVVDLMAETTAPGGPKLTAAMASTPKESGLKAGFADDNAQYNYFLNFIETYKQLWPFRELPLANRIMVRVVDENGDHLPNVWLRIANPAGSIVDLAKTYADGQALITPPLELVGDWRLLATAKKADGQEVGAELAFTADGPRALELVLPLRRQLVEPVPLDLVFVLDTTGSMGEEIERLKATIDIIRDNLDMAKPRPSLRFGLVLYKDRDDEYIVKPYPLTSDMASFNRALATAYARGGGDEPEDLEAALEAAVSPAMGWSDNGARLIFVITDAPAHAYPDGVGYNASAEQARAAGIKIHTVGTGGLPLPGEYQLRQIAQRTRGRYIFLTYGERGESAGGVAGAVSHHTGANWTAERLEAIIIRFAKEELSALSASSVEMPIDDWYEAKSVASRPAEDILDELFTETIGRLIDYSSVAVTSQSAAVIMPTTVSTETATDSRAKRNAERFGARLLQAAATAKRFRLVERDDLQTVLAELELSLSALGGESDVIRVGNLIGAEVLLVPSLIPLVGSGGPVDANQAEWELYLKLIRVETAELLSVARARIGYGLGID